MNTFTRPQPNLIVSSKGFSVEILGRTGIRYTEGNRSMFIDSEVLATPAIAVFASSIRCWEPPFDREVIDDAKRQAIVSNITEAIRFCGETVQIM